MTSNNSSNGAIHNGAILCVGNALLDISFFGDKQALDEHGLKANDACLIERDRYEAIYAALEARYKTEDHVPGGASQNTARATQWALHNHPGTVTYMGCIGKDSVGDILKDKARQAGVNGVYQVIQDGTPTGCCLVILVEHHRSLAAYLGAAVKFTADHVKNNWEAVEKAKFVYIEGFFLSSCLDACKTLATHVAEQPQKRFMLNLSAEFVVTFHKHMVLEIMPYVDVVFGNDTEAAAFGKEMNFGTDIVKIASAIAGMEKKRTDPKRIVVITCGADPVVIAIGPDQIIRTEVPRIPADKIIDTNGAGDAFVGGFLAQLISGKSVEQAARTGSYVAGLVIQRLGCTFPAEKLDLEKLCQ